MTFKDIKQGNSVFILDKTNLSVKEGRVTASIPHIGNMGTFTQAQGQLMVDVSIEMDGTSKVYTIPENLAVTFANDIVLATTRQGLASEVERMKAEAERVLASVEQQQAVLDKAGELLAELNPQFKERQETEKRFRGLEGKVDTMASMVQKLLDKLS